MKKTLVGIAALLTAVAVGGVRDGFAQGKGRGNRSAGDRVREVLPEAELVFTTRETVVVKDWFTSNRSSLPPGLAKREKLPPGLARQLRKRGTLPPGLQKKTLALPSDLERRLRTLPTGYRRAVIAGNVVLMNETTAVIYDIIRNVIP